MPGRGLPPGPAQVGLYGQIPCELASFPALDFSDLSGALFHPHGCPHIFSSSHLPHRDKNNLFRKPWGECRNETLTACARPGLPPPSAILVSLALLVGCGLSAVTEKGVWSGGRDLQGPGVTSSCRATSFSCVLVSLTSPLRFSSLCTEHWPYQGSGLRTVAPCSLAPSSPLVEKRPEGDSDPSTSTGARPGLRAVQSTVGRHACLLFRGTWRGAEGTACGGHGLVAAPGGAWSGAMQSLRAGAWWAVDPSPSGMGSGGCVRVCGTGCLSGRACGALSPRSGAGVRPDPGRTG